MELKHPTLPSTVEVDEADVKKWVRAGWIAPKQSAPKPSPKPAKADEPAEGPDTK